MDGLMLTTIDVAGGCVRINVQRRSGMVDFCFNYRKLGEFFRGDLFEWLDRPSGRFLDGSVTLNSVAEKIVLEVDVLFVSQVVAERDIELLKTYVSAEIDGSDLAVSYASAVQVPRAESGLRRVRMEVVTGSGRAAPVEFRIGGTAVEVWFRQTRSGVFDREAMRDWLARPEKPLVQDSTAFSLDRSGDWETGVSISLPDVLVWRLAPVALQQLGDALARPALHEGLIFSGIRGHRPGRRLHRRMGIRPQNGGIR